MSDADNAALEAAKKGCWPCTVRTGRSLTVPCMVRQFLTYKNNEGRIT